MSKLSMAVALAFGLALSPATQAEEFTTSRGVQQLPPVLTLTTEPLLAQASAKTELVLIQLMRDVGEVDKQRLGVVADASGVAARVAADREALERMRADYETVHGKYVADLASFQQRQSSLDAEIQRQRAEAAALAAKLDMDRPFADVKKSNDWATDIATRRTALEAERVQLLQTRDEVEAKRLKLADARRDADSRLGSGRKEISAQASQADAKLAAVTAQLRAAVAYLERVRSYYPLRLKRAAPASTVLQQAKQLLARLDARPPAR